MKKQVEAEVDITENDVYTFIRSMEGGVLCHTHILLELVEVYSPEAYENIFTSFGRTQSPAGLADKLLALHKLFAKYEKR